MDTDALPRPGTAGGPTAPGTSPAPRSTAAILVLACAAQFMVILDVSIVNVALPSIRAELHLSSAGQQWIVNAYTLGFAGLLLLGGRLADLVGTRRAFLTGLAAFTAASFAGGLAPGGALLIAARAVQGVGGAVLAPATLTLIMTTFTEPAARTRAMGAWSAVMAAGGAAGAVVGGVLTQYAGWRWVLFVNVPLGAVLLAAALAYVPAATGAGGGLRRLDLPGAVTVTAGLTALVYGIIAGETHGWDAPAVWGPVAAAVVLLGAFLAVEARVAHPLVPLAVLRRRTLATANLVVIAIGAAMFSMWFLLSLYLQQVLGYTALQAGLCFLPGALSIIAASRLATRCVGRVGARPLLVGGMTVSAVGFAWLSQLSAGGSYATDVAAPFVLATFGAGLAAMPTTMTATSGAAREEAGLASGLVNTSRQVGGALGLAVLGTVASRTTAARLAGHAHDVPAALAAGYGRGLLLAAACAACAALGGLALPRRTTKP
ncbi:DHA2 family efflux MFS transporter permease subunit [Streptomyces sp. SCA3-4]|uniref:DHA2 family efflux MFS transporter permease subunit n=1 Tax=Streptomyces sichuanensis TaxID=2871810 RepID=UPI001CE254BE|nr:DHA2 family efflux MFS transporter permease subunit [Streptomyces sichuanensis]MCA6092450.1 DHA2 family efflux MFS transporter permease subunit [Streptomyces sichuanensis]